MMVTLDGRQNYFAIWARRTKLAQQRHGLSLKG